MDLDEILRWREGERQIVPLKRLLRLVIWALPLLSVMAPARLSWGWELAGRE